MNLQGDHQSIGSVLSGLNDEFKEQEVAEKAKELGLGYINLTKISINMDFLSLVTKQESKSASLIPYFGVGRKIRLAITNLQNPNIKLIIDRLKEQEYEVAISLCSDESMAHAQQSYTSDLHFEKKEIIADDSQKAESLDQEIELIRQIPQKIGNLKGEEALNLLHIEVLKLKASDVHFEPQKNKTLKVRARIDGVLIEFFTLDQDKAVDMVRTVKHLAKLKLNIDYLPQDGKYTFDATDRAVDVRVSTLPVKNGESIVMRFLDSKKSILNVDDLGFSVKAYADFKKSLASTNGIILSTGPTGSGKTTTLHSALSYINTPDKKIVTVEDPVEFQIPGIVQCEINADKGLTFASGLRSILRQDPNVVMIGEIRDQETAETAIQASLTGHLVFSTLHTNSASDSIPRLLNMGIRPFILAPSLRCIVAQRLARRLCPNCKKKRQANQSEMAEISRVVENLNLRGEQIEFDGMVYEACGCSECSNIGYKGQMLIAEVLYITDEIRQMVYSSPTSKDILDVAHRNGMRDMWEEGVCRVIRGDSTIDEIARNIERQY